MVAMGDKSDRKFINQMFHYFEGITKVDITRFCSLANSTFEDMPLVISYLKNVSWQFE